MTTTIVKSLSTDFPNGLANHVLHEQINTNAGITPLVTSIGTFGDVVTIYFDSVLSAGDITAVEVIISNYTYAQEPSDQMVLISNSSSYSSNSYTQVASFEYLGSNNGKKIIGIDVSSWLDMSGSYHIRIEDDTNDNVICTKSLTNTSQSFNSISPLVNIPTGKSKLVFSVKSAAGKKVYIESITILYA